MTLRHTEQHALPLDDQSQPVLLQREAADTRGSQGKERYHRRMLSPTDPTVHWEGELLLKQNTAAR
jgi:hypothetical protein